MKPYSQQDTQSSNATQQKKYPLVSLARAIGIALLVIVLVSLFAGLLWGWSMTLPFFLGGSLFACCCFLSYYSRISFSFNNIPDTNQNGFFAYITNSIPRHHRHTHAPDEPFQPFKFKPTSSTDDAERARQEEEDRRVRAILRQVFPDDDL